MSETKTILILSDIHYASAAEQQRVDYEYKAVSNSLIRLANRAHRYFIWMRDPFAHNYLLDDFIHSAGEPEYVVANGDYSCDSAFIGVADDAACASALECLGKLRAKFGERFHATIGDHELGKASLFGGVGGMRLASWQRTEDKLKIKSFWRIEVGRYLLLGITSSLAGLAVYERDMLPEERQEWESLREAHLQQIRDAFSGLRPNQRVILFCHDPSALPFLWHEDAVRQRLSQVEQTIIGHLHTPLVLWKSRRLAGMPRITFLGKSIQRMSTALNEARHWQPFKVRLCPSLPGIQMLKDGGYYSVQLDLKTERPAQFQFHPLKWRAGGNNAHLAT